MACGYALEAAERLVFGRHLGVDTGLSAPVRILPGNTHHNNGYSEMQYRGISCDRDPSSGSANQIAFV